MNRESLPGMKSGTVKKGEFGTASGPDPEQLDRGVEAIDFGTGEHKEFPEGINKAGRMDSERAFPEHESFNRGGDPAGLQMRISAHEAP